WFIVSLEMYRQKRKFDQSPEPEGKATAGRGPLRFVVQKHDASRLHYDFRLELGGTLKSWAVPKGPSLNPKDKRLAIMVEDHPIDYRTFEGVIPAGNYGAGTVMIWDEGTYHTPQTADRAACEKILQKDLEDGHLRVVLQGKKLKGEFSLVKLQNAEKNAWLLLKKRDEFAASSPGTEMDRSAATHRTMDEIARQAARSATVGQSKRHSALPDLSDAPKSKFPTKVRPMLATFVDEPF